MPSSHLILCRPLLLLYTALLSSRDGYILELTVWPKMSQASCGVWRDSAQGLVPLRWGCALPSPNAPGKALGRGPSVPRDARGSHHTSRRSQAVPPATRPQESSTSRAQSAPAPRFQHSAQHAQPSTGPQGRRPPRPDTAACGLVHGTKGTYGVRWGLPEPHQAVPPRAAGGST